MGCGREHEGRAGFTLVELLVVVAVIAILIAVLFPALSGALTTAHRVASMNNMRQLTAGALAYTYDYGERWPVTPVALPPPGRQDPVLFDSYVWGGKTSSDYWTNSASYHEVGERLLNSYLYPDLDLVDPEGSRLELDVFRCPADNDSYQRVYWRYRPPAQIHPPLPVSSYDDVGTSYHLNLNWWYESERPGESDLARWVRTERIFRRGGLGGPSKFVWMYDETMDVVAVHGSTIMGDHGEVNRAKAAYQDGHVAYVPVEPRAPSTMDYHLLLE